MNKDQLREAVLGTAAWKQVGVITESVAAVEEQEVIEEGKEVSEEHSCPLCESKLDEQLSDEVLLEHADQMLEVFQEAENIIVESEKEEEEGDEEDLLEGLDEEDIQFLAKMSRELKSKKVETK